MSSTGWCLFSLRFNKRGGIMNYENEITVEVNTTLEDLISILENNGFKLKETYDLNDIYLINKVDKKK